MIQDIVIALNLLVAGCLAVHDPHWSYTKSQSNFNNWAAISPRMCSGSLQSPIALDSNAATYLGKATGAVVDISFSKSVNSGTFTATNNGHSSRCIRLSPFNTVEVGIPPGTWTVTLNNKAKDFHNIDQLHFHWGGGNRRGSEHTLDGRSFPLEMHIVAYASIYANFSAAQSAPGGLAVIGVFFQLTTDQSKSNLSKMGNLLSVISQLNKAGSTVRVNSFDPKVLLPANRDEFFRYHGSLTTPPCTENVQ
nr:unnamed protein product [Spirometra erinaceieuropaei]